MMPPAAMPIIEIGFQVLHGGAYDDYVDADSDSLFHLSLPLLLSYITFR